MSEVTLDMLLSGTKPASAPVQAAQVAHGAPGVRGDAAAGEGDESFSSALSRHMEGGGADEASNEVVEASDGEAGGEGAHAEEASSASTPPREEASTDDEEVADAGDGELADAVVEEVELPPGLEFLDLPVAAVTLPPSGNGLPVAGNAPSAARPVLAEPARPADLVLAAEEGDPLAAQRRTVAAAVTAAVGESSGEDGKEGRAFSQLLGSRLAAAATSSASADGSTPAVPQMTALTGAVAGGATATQALSATPPAVRSAIDTPFRQPGWNDSLGNRVVWMANEKIEKAEIRLNPPSLGPIEVRVTMNGDQASVSFVAQNASVRDALEQALPRLREMMGESGLNLAEADVSDAHRDQSAREGDADGGGRGRGGRGADGGQGEDVDVGDGLVTAVGNGMLDLYA